MDAAGSSHSGPNDSSLPACKSMDMQAGNWISPEPPEISTGPSPLVVKLVDSAVVRRPGSILDVTGSTVWCFVYWVKSRNLIIPVLGTLWTFVTCVHHCLIWRSLVDGTKYLFVPLPNKMLPDLCHANECWCFLWGTASCIQFCKVQNSLLIYRLPVRPPSKP